ncbi:MAG: hypothetical protein KDC12_05870 [Flavobacteriales bacterium]|nr:hypothetical protein [Flavobacteriales bacterium]
MIKYTLLVLNVVGVLFAQIFFDDGVVIEDNTPTSIKPGETKTVEMTINKGEITGFAKLEIILPGGLSISPVNTQGASFTAGNKTKFIWMNLPDAQEFTITYNLTADASASGNLVVKGTFSYIKESQRVDYALQSKLIAIGLADDSNDEDVASNEEDVNSENSSMGSMSCTRYITAISATEYLIKLEVEHANLEGFAKIMENVPPGFAVEEDDSDGAIATIETNGIKFVWFDAPELEQFSVSYRIQAMSSVGDPEIDGTFSYVADNSPQEMPVADGGMSQEDLASNTTEETDNDPVVEEPVVEEPVVEEEVEDVADNSSGQQQSADNTGSGSEKNTSETVEKTDTGSKASGSENNMTADNNNNNPPAGKSATSVPEPETGVTYRVQIVAGHNTVGKAYFKKRHDFSENFSIEHHEGWVKYTTGSHGEYKQARDNRERINAKYNFRGPFVTAYNNGDRITVQEALMITKQQWYQ